MTEFLNDLKINVDILLGDGTTGAFSVIVVGLTANDDLPSTGGTGGVTVASFSLFADPRLMIPLGTSDALYQGFSDRLAAVATFYRYISPTATGGYTANTSLATLTHFNDLPAVEKAMPIMPNAEFPWLEILAHGDTEPLDPTWQTDNTVIAEAAIQGMGTPDSSWGITQYRNLAIACWNDITAGLTAAGVTMVAHYASTSVAFGSYFGVPNGALRYTAPVTGTDNWFRGNLAWHKTLEDTFADSVAQGKLTALRRAQVGAIDGAAAYSFIPNSGKAVEEIDRWANSAERDDIHGNILSPDFTVADLRRATRITSRRMWGEYRSAIQDTIDDGGLTQSEYPSHVAAIVFGSAINAQLSIRIVRQAQFGLYAKDPTLAAADEVVAMFDPGDDNWPLADPPDSIWFWHSGDYYFWTEPSRTTVPGPSITTDYIRQTNMMRWSHEVDFLQRPWPPTADDFPWGATGDVTTHEWYEDNRMSDDWWTNQSSVWWTVAGGSQLPAPCVLDQTSLLAPYLDWSANITWTHIRRAVRAAVAEQLVSGVEEARAALTTIGI